MYQEWVGREEMPPKDVRRYTQKGLKRNRRERCHGSQAVEGIMIDLVYYKFGDFYHQVWQSYYREQFCQQMHRKIQYYS